MICRDFHVYHHIKTTSKSVALLRKISGSGPFLLSYFSFDLLLISDMYV